MREALRRVCRSSNWAMVAVNCAHGTADFLGTAAAIFCSAVASGGLPAGGAARKAFQILSALLAPTPGSRRTIRLKAASSRGLVTNFSQAATSLMWACSQKRRPLVMLKGMLRRVSSNCNSRA